jgi:hypothetical protein
MNFLTGQVQRSNGDVHVRIGEFDLKPHKTMEPALKKYDGEQVIIGIRAENMETFNKPLEDALQGAGAGSRTVGLAEPADGQDWQ